MYKESLFHNVAGEERPALPPSYPFLEVVASLMIRRKLLLWVAISGAIVSAATVCLLPPRYTATATIVPPAKPQSTAAALMGQLSSMTGALTGSSSSLGMKDPADMYIGILKSRTIADDLVKRYQLATVYGCKTAADARRTLQEHVSFSSGKDSLLKISVEEKDPALAANLANGFIDALQHQNDRLAVTESAQRRLFFERSLQGQKRTLANAEEQLKTVQQQTGLIHAPAQAEATIRSIAQLRAEITVKEVEAARVRLIATAENPQLRGVETELASLRTQLGRMQSQTGDSVNDPLVPTGKAPDASLKLMRAMREVKYQEAIFELLSKQYEAAKIDEARESQVIQVVDAATVPDRKSGPPRGIITILGALSAFITACIYVLLLRPMVIYSAALRDRAAHWAK